MLAAFPTIKFPAQNKTVKNKNKYAILFLLVTKFKQTFVNYKVLNLD